MALIPWLEADVMLFMASMKTSDPFVTDGDWLDRNFGGGGWGAPDISGQAISYLMMAASCAPIAGEINDYSQLVTGIGNNGERLTKTDRLITAGALLTPLVGAGIMRKLARWSGVTEHIDEGIEALADIPTCFLAGTPVLVGLDRIHFQQLVTEDPADSLTEKRVALLSTGLVLALVSTVMATSRRRCGEDKSRRHGNMKQDGGVSHLGERYETMP